MNHVQARQIMLQAWPVAMGGGSPALPELQIAQALASHESNYGAGWKGACAASHNWGAIQSSRPPCGANGCLYTDSSPQADGTSKRYDVCFKVYSDDVTAAADAIKTMYVNNKRSTVYEAAKRGNIHDAAAALYDTGYYQSFGPDRATRIKNYESALNKEVLKIASANKEKVSATLTGGAPSEGNWWIPMSIFVAGVASVTAVGWLAWRELKAPKHNPAQVLAFKKRTDSADVLRRQLHNATAKAQYFENEMWRAISRGEDERELDRINQEMFAQLKLAYDYEQKLARCR